VVTALIINSLLYVAHVGDSRAVLYAIEEREEVPRVPCAVCRVPCAVCRVPCAVCRVPCAYVRACS
jgi:hypothetical protein